MFLVTNLFKITYSIWFFNPFYFYRNTWLTTGQRSRENPSMYAWDGDFANDNRIPQDMQFWLPNDQTHLSPTARQEDVIVYKFDGNKDKQILKIIL